MSKITDNEIIKALECCTANKIVSCKEMGCHFRKLCINDVDALEKASLDLINRQKAEIERLNRSISTGLTKVEHNSLCETETYEGVKE